MAPRPALTAKSSLYAHCFPSFYACYLLKSIKTPDSQTVYIGSTPSPPRRIRQHNGELTQGARKTQTKRPWVMQMIVHGFPSRLAALQFEWAWQHPQKSRHLRDDNDKPLFSRGARMVKPSIEVVQAMIRSHPFNLWPLHVKLFTEEARDVWYALLDRRAKLNATKRGPGKAADPPTSIPYESHFPPGFTWSVELEGVDGRSGHSSGSGRSGPLQVKDEHFSSLVWAKNTVLSSSTDNVSCAVCGGDVPFSQEDPLNTTLCPHDGCLSVSHFACLAKAFLSSPGPLLFEAPLNASASTSTAPIPQHTFNQQSTIIPRGGNCPTCQRYTLWGDIIRSQYRRKADQDALPEKENADDDVDDGLASDDLFTSDSELTSTPKSRSSRLPFSKGKAKASLDEGHEGVSPVPKRRVRKAKAANDQSGGQSSSGESFDLDVSSSSSDNLLTEILKPKRKVKRQRTGKEGPTAIDTRNRVQATGKVRVSKGDAPSTPAKRGQRRAVSPVSSGGESESDLFLPDAAPGAAATPSSSGGRKCVLPATVAESEANTPKPKRRRVGHLAKTVNTVEPSGSPRPYSTNPTATTAADGGNFPALRTPRPFPLLSAHPTLSNIDPTILMLPSSDSGSDTTMDYDLPKLGAAHTTRMTKRVVDGRLQEIWELGSDDSGMQGVNAQSAVDRAPNGDEVARAVGGGARVVLPQGEVP